jgi:hypothetical protein
MSMHGGKGLRIGTTLGLWLTGNIGIFPVNQHSCRTGKEATLI